ncbi:glycosyltransferase family 2 protein [Polynucleobacter sp. MWH-Berg-3C6]|uniref:glycosyltransferase family 2 protein n=1 Tax=Polynucleobacter sp. MWH-Berg-3C6 TaxID=1855882 RepID=UPI001C0E8734|nr:glycosyltransferase family 2 protein [Polynucleobacter sp. MWH-Berg-3C6]MBU3549907.1 glycosyltransferase [Polynucleobacter sp. MWH-Berg-3C6]
MKISVITACFNSEHTIAPTLQSVSSQSYQNYEHLIIDGNSSDQTIALIEKCKNPRIIFRSERDDGIYDALNKGIQYSTGDVIGFLHADDVFDSKDTLKKIAEVFLDPQIDAVYGDLVYVRQDNINKIVRYWRAGGYSKLNISRGWMLPHPTFYVRRTLYKEYGGFNKNYRISADYDSILRFLTTGSFNAAYIPEVLVRMRLGGISNRSFSTIFRKSLEDLRIARANEVGGLGTVLLKNLSKIKQFWKHY